MSDEKAPILSGEGILMVEKEGGIAVARPAQASTPANEKRAHPFG